MKLPAIAQTRLLALAFVVMAAGRAESGIVNDLSDATRSLAEAREFCGRSEFRRLGRMMASEGWVANSEPVGAVSPFKETAHIYAIDEARSGSLVLTLWHPVNAGKPKSRQNCYLAIFLDSGIQDVTLTTPTGFRTFTDLLTRKEKSSLAAIRKRCAALGDKAPFVFTKGSYDVASDGSVAETGIFSCDAAVANSVSVVRVKSAKLDFVIVGIGGDVFLREE